MNAVERGHGREGLTVFTRSHALSLALSLTGGDPLLQYLDTREGLVPAPLFSSSTTSRLSGSAASYCNTLAGRDSGLLSHPAVRQPIPGKGVRSKDPQNCTPCQRFSSLYFSLDDVLTDLGAKSVHPCFSESL